MRRHEREQVAAVIATVGKECISGGRELRSIIGEGDRRGDKASALGIWWRTSSTLATEPVAVVSPHGPHS